MANAPTLNSSMLDNAIKKIRKNKKQTLLFLFLNIICGHH